MFQYNLTACKWAGDNEPCVVVCFWSWIKKFPGYLAYTSSHVVSKGIWQHTPFVPHALCTVLLTLHYCMELYELLFSPHGASAFLLISPSDSCFCQGNPRSHPLNEMSRGSQAPKEGKAERSLSSKKEHTLLRSTSALQNCYHGVFLGIFTNGQLLDLHW